MLGMTPGVVTNTVTITADQSVVVAKSAEASAPAAAQIIKEKAKPSKDDAKATASPKLHPSIASVIQRTKQNSSASTDESKFVNGNIANIQIWLTLKNATVLAQLKQLGLEIISDPKDSKLLIGKISIEKLSKLAELEFVRFIAPDLK